MIRKHIDLIAVAVLLCGIAVYSRARTCIVFQVNHTAGFRFSPRQPFHQPIVAIPKLPRIPYTSD